VGHRSGYHLGARDGRGEWTLALYHIEKENIPSRDPNDPDPTVIRQIGEQSSRGIELTAGIRPLDKLAIHGNLAILSAEYDVFLDGNNDFSGNTPVNVPEQTANLWATWFVNPEWRVGGGLRYVGQRYRDDANTQRLASYATADFFTAWQPRASTEVALRLRNAFDREYVSAPVYSNNVLLGEPRTVELALSTRF
jgi:iron complex outermembrane receptor protein